MTIKIRMFSDYICPFCYLGKAIVDRLKKRYDVEIEHVGIEIHPETPSNGVDLGERIPGINEIYEHLRSRGKEYNLNFCDVRVLPNSRKSLIVGEYAKKIGKNEEFTSEIFKAYFEKCLDIGKDSIIIQVAKKIGFKEKDVKEALENPSFNKSFADNCLEARKLCIAGVPTFIINDENRITGAQPEQVFVELFEKIDNHKFK